MLLPHGASLATLALALAHLACAATAATAEEVSSPPSVPRTTATDLGWRVDEAVDPEIHTSEHELHFWLRPSDPGALDEAVRAVSMPSSLRYRQYLTSQEISPLVAPPEGTVARLEDWLKRSRVSYHLRMSKHGDFAFVRAPVHDWEKIFGSFGAYYHAEAPGRQVIRLKRAQDTVIESYEHTSRVSGVDDVRAIFGLTDFYPVVRSSTDRDGPCSQFKGSQVDPNVIHQQYNVSSTSNRRAVGKHSQGIAAFEDAEFVPSDVARFESDYKLYPVNVSVRGPNNGGFFGEASLDTQYIHSTSNGVETWFINQRAFDMLKWSWFVLNMTEPPKVLSVSWGNGESGFDVAHQHAASAEFAKMGLSGISILTASGDDGTGKQGFWRCKAFDPTWPASSPYVTAVGGTYLDTDHEVGWGFSGGGFSAVFSRPQWQDSAVAAYKSSTTLPPATLFNASGRATPDVSALATNYRTLGNGAYGCISGTSAATPVFAGMLSAINDRLISDGKAPVGFINPAIYSAGSVGTDVTEGNNKQSGCPAGFGAATGYDAITGLGTPDFERLATLLGA